MFLLVAKNLISKLLLMNFKTNNIDQKAYVEISEFGSVIHMNSDVARSCIHVRESFQTIKRELVY